MVRRRRGHAGAAARRPTDDLHRRRRPRRRTGHRHHRRADARLRQRGPQRDRLRLCRTGARHADRRPGDVHLLRAADAGRHPHRPAVGGYPVDHLQLRRIHRRDRARLVPVGAQGPPRGRPRNRPADVEGASLRHRPCRLPAADPAARQPVHRQPQGHVAVHRHRRRRTDPAGPGDHGGELPCRGGLVGGRDPLPDHDRVLSVALRIAEKRMRIL